MQQQNAAVYSSSSMRQYIQKQAAAAVQKRKKSYTRYSNRQQYQQMPAKVSSGLVPCGPAKCLSCGSLMTMYFVSLHVHACIRACVKPLY